MSGLEALRDPAWTRLLTKARTRVERDGGLLFGDVSLTQPSDAERRLVIGITGKHRAPGVKSVAVNMGELSDAIEDETGYTLLAALGLLGGPVRNRTEEKVTEAEAISGALADAAQRCPRHRDEPWFQAWLDSLVADGLVTRLVRKGAAEQLGWAGAVLQHLPGQAISLPVLAELATGNTKALSGAGIAALVLRALRTPGGISSDIGTALGSDRRSLWESAGVIMDDLASQVLVLGIRAKENHIVADWLADAAQFGVPFRLTLHQLATDPLTVKGRELYVCENPAVLRAAVSGWHSGRVPIICTEGQPSAAVHRLLSQYPGKVHWRGDFDWTGLRTTATAITRYHAVPWRMSTQDYLAGLDSAAEETEALKGSAAPSPWEPELAHTMSEHGRAVMEERLIDTLVADLD